ncbi:MAG: hypothetical protein WDO13_17560 [Verrucomicrobiota bacterium]
MVKMEMTRALRLFPELRASASSLVFMVRGVGVGAVVGVGLAEGVSNFSRRALLKMTKKAPNSWTKLATIGEM